LRRGRGSALRYRCAALRGPDCTRRTRTAGTRRWTWKIGWYLRNTGSVPENGAARRTFLPTRRPVRDSSFAPFQRLLRHSTSVDPFFTNCHHHNRRSVARIGYEFLQEVRTAAAHRRWRGQDLPCDRECHRPNRLPASV